MNTNNKQIATNILLNANYNSDLVQLKNIVLYAISANITGTPTGTLYLEASADPETNTTQPSTWVPTHWSKITGSDITVTTSGVSIWNVRDPGYNYVRVVFVDASSGASTARMSIVYNGKGV